MKVLLARRPHAIVRRVDPWRAEAMEGVIAVFTSKDVPCNEFGYYTYDQPVLCGPSAKPYADRVRYVGDRVAAVVAETEEIARQAVEQIVVDYEDLPIECDQEEAMRPDATVLHPERGSKVFGHHILRNGDVEQGFYQADVIVEAVYNTPAQEHAYLQTEAGLAYIDEQGRVAVVTTGQWGAKDRKQMAHALGLPEDCVRVIYPMTGGAFGGREDISVQILAGLAAMKLNERGIHRPVKTVWTRSKCACATWPGKDRCRRAERRTRPESASGRLRSSARWLLGGRTMIDEGRKTIDERRTIMDNGNWIEQSFVPSHPSSVMVLVSPAPIRMSAFPLAIPNPARSVWSCTAKEKLSGR